MKRYAMGILMVYGLVTGIAGKAEEGNYAPRVIISPTLHPESPATKLSVEEMAFAAKLSDAHRRAFIDKLTVEQRKLAMAAAAHASIENAADEAVEKILESTGGLSEKHKSRSIALDETVHIAP